MRGKNAGNQKSRREEHAPRLGFRAQGLGCPAHKNRNKRAVTGEELLFLFVKAFPEQRQYCVFSKPSFEQYKVFYTYLKPENP